MNKLLLHARLSQDWTFYYQSQPLEAEEYEFAINELKYERGEIYRKSVRPRFARHLDISTAKRCLFMERLANGWFKIPANEATADRFEPARFEWTEEGYIAREAAKEFSERTEAEYD